MKKNQKIDAVIAASIFALIVGGTAIHYAISHHKQTMNVSDGHRLEIFVKENGDCNPVKGWRLVGYDSKGHQTDIHQVCASIIAVGGNGK